MIFPLWNFLENYTKRKATKPLTSLLIRIQDIRCCSWSTCNSFDHSSQSHRLRAYTVKIVLHINRILKINKAIDTQCMLHIKYHVRLLLLHMLLHVYKVPSPTEMQRPRDSLNTPLYWPSSFDFRVLQTKCIHFCNIIAWIGRKTKPRRYGRHCGHRS